MQIIDDLLSWYKAILTVNELCYILLFLTSWSLKVLLHHKSHSSHLHIHIAHPSLCSVRGYTVLFLPRLHIIGWIGGNIWFRILPKDTDICSRDAGNWTTDLPFSLADNCSSSRDTAPLVVNAMLCKKDKLTCSWWNNYVADINTTIIIFSCTRT